MLVAVLNHRNSGHRPSHILNIVAGTRIDGTERRAADMKELKHSQVLPDAVWRAVVVARFRALVHGAGPIAAQRVLVLRILGV